MPDFFDRLVLRSLPELAGPDTDSGGSQAPDGAQAWVRPRLPQLFERPGLEIQETEVEAAARPGRAAGAQPGPPDLRVVERTAVVPAPQTAVAPTAAVPQPATPTGPPAAVPRPSAPPAVAGERADGTGPATPPSVRAEERRHSVGAEAPAPVTGYRTDPSATAPLAGQSVPWTQTDPRRAARTPAAEIRGARSPERVVWVSIGRLAVTAPAPETRERQRPTRPAPRVSLDRYLSRESGREEGRKDE